jgi:predicted phosphodiesterase
VVLALVVALGLVYWWNLGPQTVSMLTHRKGAPTETWALAPLPAEPDLRIAAVGDVGEGEEEEWQTSWAISEVGAEPPYDVLLLLGDNVYPSGDPARLPYTVFRPFDRVLDEGAALFAIVGNHDAGHADEQMEILGMPGTWWAEHLPGDVLLIGLDSNRVGDPAQRAFLEETLREATERWRIVAVHEPPYSAGYQGSNLAVRETFTPLFVRYGVQLVLSGHEHDYQRNEPDDGVTYLVSGAGGRTRGTGEEPFTAVSYAVYHFVDVNVFPDRMLVRAVDQDARAFDAFAIEP